MCLLELRRSHSAYQWSSTVYVIKRWIKMFGAKRGANVNHTQSLLSFLHSTRIASHILLQRNETPLPLHAQLLCISSRGPLPDQKLPR